MTPLFVTNTDSLKQNSNHGLDESDQKIVFTGIRIFGLHSIHVKTNNHL